MPGETFGEADVILRVRLDQLQQDMDQAERIVVEQSERLQAAHRDTAASARRAGEESGRSAGVIGQIAAGALGWKALEIAIKLAVRQLMLIPAVALAAKAALIGLVVGGVVLVGNAIDKVVGTVDRAVRAVRESIDAARGLDGTTGSVLELAQALEKIPFVGRAAGLAFRVFSGDAEVADRAMLGLIGRVEDGEVKINGFARFLARGVGLGHMIRDLERTNEKLREFSELNAASLGRQRGSAAAAAGFDPAEQSAADTARLAGLEGVQRVRALNQIERRDALQHLEDVRNASREDANARLREVDRLMQAEEISARQAQLRRTSIEAEIGEINRRHDEARMQVEKDLATAGRQRIRDAEKLIQLETRRRAAAVRSAELAAAGDVLGSDLVMIEHRRQEEILTAMESGQRRQISSINRFYNAQARIARDAAQRDADAERARQQKRFESMQKRMQRELALMQKEKANLAASVEDRTLSAQAELAAVNLRNQGEDFEAQRVEMEDRIRQRIDQAIRDGDKELLETLQQLRDAERQRIEILENEEKMREREKLMRDASFATARQIDTALIGIGGGGNGDPKKEEKDAVKELKKIVKNTKNPAARAG